MQPGQNHVEPGGILGGEPAREEVLANIIEVEFGLYTDHICLMVGKGEDRLFQLQAVRNVFSIVDDDIGTCG